MGFTLNSVRFALRLLHGSLDSAKCICFFQASFYMPQNPTNFPFNHVQKFHQNLSPRKVRIFEEPDAADDGVPPADGSTAAVDGSTAVDGATSSAPPLPPPPPPPPPGPMPPNHPPPQGDAVMPLGQDFFIV